MTLFLWHQTAFLAVTAAGLIAGPLPGLHTAPSSPAWAAERLAWLPAFAAALAAAWIAFRWAERARSAGRRRPGGVPGRSSGSAPPAGRAPFSSAPRSSALAGVEGPDDRVSADGTS
jgi:hypothetical protein